MIVNLPLAAEAMTQGYAVKFSSGYVTKATTTGEAVYGFALTSVDNSGGSAGDLYVGVVTHGIMKLSSYVGDTDAAGTYSTPIAIGDQLTIGVIANVPYVVSAGFASATSIIVGYALEANAGSTSAATVKTIAVEVIQPKVDGGALV